MLAACPDSAWAWSFLAATLYNRAAQSVNAGAVTAGTALVRKALCADPALAPARRLLALLLCRQADDEAAGGDLDGAMCRLDVAAAFEPEATDVVAARRHLFLLKAAAHLDAGRLDDTLKALGTGLALGGGAKPAVPILPTASSISARP